MSASTLLARVRPARRLLTLTVVLAMTALVIPPSTVRDAPCPW